MCHQTELGDVLQNVLRGENLNPRMFPCEVTTCWNYACAMYAYVLLLAIGGIV